MKEINKNNYEDNLKICNEEDFNLISNKKDIKYKNIYDSNISEQIQKLNNINDKPNIIKSNNNKKFDNFEITINKENELEIISSNIKKDDELENNNKSHNKEKIDNKSYEITNNSYFFISSNKTRHKSLKNLEDFIEENNLNIFIEQNKNNNINKKYSLKKSSINQFNIINSTREIKNDKLNAILNIDNNNSFFIPCEYNNNRLKDLKNLLKNDNKNKEIINNKLNNLFNKEFR